MERTLIGQDNLVQQHYNDTCAIKSQQLILNEFGIPCTEDQLVVWSSDNGLYDGNGTAMQDVGKIIAQANIPCTQKVDANMFDIVGELSQGHKVIVGVHSSELWNGGIWETIKDFFIGDTPDHALIVAGIDNSDPNNPIVLLTDPGTGDVCKPYPLDQFIDAWRDSSCYMVSTDVAPAEFANTQNINHQPLAYIPDVAGVSYQDFQLFHDISTSLPTYDMWNNDIQSHPMNSLVSAYLDYGNTDVNMDFSDIFDASYGFTDYIDTDTFVQNYLDTFDGNMDYLLSNHQMNQSQWDSFVNGNANADLLNNYFDNQISLYSSEGNYEMVNFFEQQSHFIDFCEDFGVDPLTVYANI